MVLVRNCRYFIESFATSAAYLRDAATDSKSLHYGDYGIELSQNARSMKLPEVSLSASPVQSYLKHAAKECARETALAFHEA